MERTGLATVLLTLMVVLAGCTGGVGTVTETQTDGTVDAMTAVPSDGGDTVRMGTVSFYMSDERSAIADLEHLNIIIERVTLVRASGDAESEIEANTNDAEADDEIGTETESEADIANDTDAKANASVEVEIEASAMANTTNMSASTNRSVDVDADADTDADTDADIESADVNGTSTAEGESRVAYEVDNATVDLTELQGENMSLIGGYGVPEGDYTKVFVHMSEVNGTPKTGGRVDMRLPSNRLQLDTDFEVGNGESVNLVFDITAFETGNSGKCIPKSVVSGSGTGIPITRAGAKETTDVGTAAETKADVNAEVEATENETNDNGERVESDAEGDLSVSFDGNVSVGENVTVVITWNGMPVGNATVTINGEVAGTTDAGGELGIAISNERGVTAVAVDGESEAEAEFEFEVAGSALDNPDEGGESTTLAV